MIRVYVFVEGQTEETFVKGVLQAHFLPFNVYLYPILLSTSCGHKGGVTSYERIKGEILRKCDHDSKAYVTTIIDFYQRPKNMPGVISSLKTNPFEKVKIVEEAFTKDIGRRNFFAYLSLHEFESLLYSNLEMLNNWFDKKPVAELIQEYRQFESPEHVNESLETSPSHRITAKFPSYEKVLHGTLIALDIGLESILKECRHFRDWIERIEGLVDKAF